MRWEPLPLPAVLLAVCACVITVEVYVVFMDTDRMFTIHGTKLYDVNEFGAGKPVSHAFLMRGDGLNSVSVRLRSTAIATVRVQWILWRGYPDYPNEMGPAFEGVKTIDLRPGLQWKSFEFVRDGSSKDRWYTFELRLLDPQPPPLPQVVIVASQDNPDRGGILFVNTVRQPGSLLLRAGRRGRTPYRRFVVEAAPNLPAVLRVPVVQWGIVIILHWALIVFAYAVLSDGARRPLSDGAS